MSKTSAKLALAVIVVMAAPAASYARMAGGAGSGNVPRQWNSAGARKRRWIE